MAINTSIYEETGDNKDYGIKNHFDWKLIYMKGMYDEAMPY